MLSSDPAGANARPFRIVGSYEPVPDPARLGEARLEARFHLPDLLQLRGDSRDPATSESVAAINVRLVDPGDAPAFARELSARLPGVIVRPTMQDDRSVDVMAILDRFHMAIALVTVVASSLFLLALMVMLVDERRGMVAVLRLIGLRRRRILQHVVVEGLMIAVAGAAFGVALAALLEGVFNRLLPVALRHEPRLRTRHAEDRLAIGAAGGSARRAGDRPLVVVARSRRCRGTRPADERLGIRVALPRAAAGPGGARQSSASQPWARCCSTCCCSPAACSSRSVTCSTAPASTCA